MKREAKAWKGPPTANQAGQAAPCTVRDDLPCIDISVGSRFHAFDLARELNSRGMLHQLHTGYPSFSARRFGLPTRSFRSVWTHEPLNRIFSKLWRRGLIQRDFDAPLSKRFDQIVSSRLRPGANLLIGWSSQCLETLQSARCLDMITIVERGSTHIEWQRAILQEEAYLTGLPTEVPDPRTVERELAEYEAADYISVPTQFVASTFTQRGIPADKLLVNPYGVDIARFTPSRTLAESPELRVIHVGRVSVRKGAHYLAQAIEQVPGAQLEMVGGIDPGIERGLKHPRITLVGPVAGNQLPSHYGRADVFCLVSLEEGLAQVVAQAMAMGLPIVATPNTGAGELITDGVDGFLVPPRDPGAVAQRLTWFAADKNRAREMGARARRRIEGGFTWADYGRRAAENYTRILTSKHN